MYHMHVEDSMSETYHSVVYAIFLINAFQVFRLPEYLNHLNLPSLKLAQLQREQKWQK